ncbi:hypothetical protein ARMSODRAFT_947826 [Armillaria solidipes]|uniref:HNH nuclease domain-containing protein n=1 Tax=Armillaria solidipes TaxID=1076256 RepID=A0A2H3C6Z1_9AGAR|nr:hypothetical protein ARMSODRAFT_947826 [Armillaria solidipes]
MSDLLTPRPPLEERADPYEHIFIIHPVRDCPFLQLGRRQKVTEGGQEHLGIPHWFVLDACLVIAGKGFLSSTPFRSGRVTTDVNGYLTGEEYRFFLDDSNDYTICTDFEEWMPPLRKDVPERWLAIDRHKKGTPNPIEEDLFSDISVCVIADDRICVVSGLNEELRATHLVPQVYASWYHMHQIYQQYTYPGTIKAPKARPIDDIRQIITLESGLLESMDHPSFVIAPFSDEYVAFFFASRRVGMVKHYHLRTVRLPQRIEGYALFTRFAWAMITIAQALPPTALPKKRKGRHESDGLSDTESLHSPPGQRCRTHATGDGGIESVPLLRQFV